MAVREELKDYRKKLKDFQSTFRKEIGDISTQQDKDLGVATDILAQRLKTETGVDPLGRKTGLAQQERREPREIRRDLLSREGAVRQATEELGPQYEAILGQLRENIAATRQAVPQELAARGQTLGGMRSATEAGLTREEAYQTAGLQAQRATDIQTRAGQIMTAQEEAAATEQARQDALRQQAFENQISTRSQELQAQGMAADEAYRQAQFEFQQTQAGQEQAFREKQLAEQQRQFGLGYGLDLRQQQLREQQAQQQAAQLATQRPDLSNYINAAMGLQGQARIDYVNNLQARGLITTDDANSIKGQIGIVTPTKTVQLPTIGVPSEERAGVPSVQAPGPEQVIGYKEPTPEVGLALKDYTNVINNQFGIKNEYTGEITGYDEQGLQSYISQIKAVDPVLGNQLSILYPGSMDQTKQQVFSALSQLEAGTIDDDQFEAILNSLGVPTGEAELDAYLSQ